jgi:uncharacterized protein (DUF1330 family)
MPADLQPLIDFEVKDREILAQRVPASPNKLHVYGGHHLWHHGQTGAGRGSTIKTRLVSNPSIVKDFLNKYFRERNRAMLGDIIRFVSQY